MYCLLLYLPLFYRCVCVLSLVVFSLVYLIFRLFRKVAWVAQNLCQFYARLPLIHHPLCYNSVRLVLFRTLPLGWPPHFGVLCFFTLSLRPYVLQLVTRPVAFETFESVPWPFFHIRICVCACLGLFCVISLVFSAVAIPICCFCFAVSPDMFRLGITPPLRFVMGVLSWCSVVEWFDRFLGS